MPQPTTHEKVQQQASRSILELELDRDLRTLALLTTPRVTPEGRVEVPASVRQYVAKRYGPLTEVDVLNRFPKPDDTGWSYSVFERGGEGKGITNLATLEYGTRSFPLGLPPDYDGPLKSRYEAWRERMELENMGTPTPKWPDIFEAIVWEAEETPVGVSKRQAQVEFKRSLSARAPIVEA